MLVGETENPAELNDVIGVLLQDVELPTILGELPLIQIHGSGWWTKLLAHLALPGW